MPQYQARGARLDLSAESGSTSQGLTRVVGLYDGGFTVTWTDADNQRTNFDGDVYGLTFGRNLARTTSIPRILVTDTGPTTSYPVNQTVTGVKTGGAALIGTDNAAYSAADAISKRDAVVRILDENGAQVGQPINLGAASPLGVTITTLTDGRLVAGWIDATGALRGQYLDSTGALSGTSFQVADPAGDFAARPGFAALAGGGWVATYVSQNAAEGRVVFYDAQGTPSAERLVADNLSGIIGVQAQGLSTGQAVLVWSEIINQTISTRVQIYSANGTPSGAEFSVAANATSVVSVASLLDGTFAIATELLNGTSEVRMFNSTGQQLGATVTIADAIEPSISALADGGFVVTSKGSDNQLHAQAFELVPESAPAMIGNSGDNSLVGDARSDTLIGLAGNDTLFGGGGLANTLQGGVGNDVYFVSAFGDSIVEFAGEGTDQIRTALTDVTMAANVEQLIYIGAGDLNAVGNDLDNLIVGGNQSNLLNGGLGADTLVAGSRNDILIGGAGLANTLQGGAGDDFYFVSVTGDTIVEFAAGGNDQVRTDVAVYTLSANVEVLSYSGAGNFIGTGNEGDNLIEGGAGSDILNGLVGADIVLGRGGDDILIGGTGVANTLQGGTGDDFYFVSVVGDTVFELAGEGRDQIRTDATSYTLPTNVEVLSFSGTGGFTGVGNELDNLIDGGTGNDILNGMAGNDILLGRGGDDILIGGSGGNTLQGGTGNDTYFISSSGDTIVEEAGEGRDLVNTGLSVYVLPANVEDLIATTSGSFTGTGNDLGNLLLGGTGNDVLNGAAGGDQLNGGLGSDVLTGGSGNDLFTFNSSLSNSNIDTITDFQIGADQILLDRAIFTAVGIGELSSSAFTIGSGATDANQRIVYTSTSGALFYDADGNGAAGAIQFASLATGLQLTAASFTGYGVPGTQSGMQSGAAAIDSTSPSLLANLQYVDSSAVLFA